MTSGRPRARGRSVRFLAPALVALAAFALLVALAGAVSPWPSALVIRWVFERGGAQMNAALAARVPTGVVSRIGLRYSAGDPDALLDLHLPGKVPPAGGWPTIVWVHGGGFLAGHRGEVANYARILAGHGYAVASVDYSLAPGARYPRPVAQVASAVGWVSDNATRHGLDAGRLVLAGDSAGAQLAAQVAALATSPRYVARVGIRPAIDRSQLIGTVLFCGPLDGSKMAASDGWFTRTVMWSYFGAPDPPREPLEQFAVVRHVTSAFPPTFISVGNGDPLAPQSMAMADALRSVRVPVDTLFFSPDHQPALPHEYQFDLTRPEGRLALERVVAFLGRLEAARPRGSTGPAASGP